MSRAGGSPPAEAALVTSFPFLAAGLVAAGALLAVPSGWPLLARFAAQLAAVTALALVMSLRLAPLASEPWFAAATWPARARRFAAAAVVVVIVTGVAALVTLASSAALRFQPSLQFLQLLSALDIAWVVAATTVGAYLRWGRGAAVLAGGLIGAFCVASIWNYLRVVGFAPDGGWLLDGGELLRLVIPGDVLAAVLAVAVLLAGLRELPAGE